MTAIQKQAIQLIYQLPDDKIKAFITLAADENSRSEIEKKEHVERKKRAFAKLEQLDLGFPADFDVEKELAAAYEEKYGIID